MRQHAGEIALPGGKVDEADVDFQAAASRETYEELGVHPSQLEHLGPAGEPNYNRAQTMLVHPLAATTKTRHSPSLDLATLKRDPAEVEQVFAVRLPALLDPARLRASYFRDVQPSWEVRVGDFMPLRAGEDDKGRVMRGIWGLSGWFSNDFFRMLRLY